MNYSNVRIFAGNSHPALAKMICDHLDIPLGNLNISYFANTETRINLNESVRGKDIFFIQTGAGPNQNNGDDIDLHVNDYVVETMLFMDTCRRSGCSSITLIMPCYAYARQDKKDSARASISSSCLARLYESCGLTRIVCVELHAACIQGFFQVCADNLYTTDLIVKKMTNDILGDNYKQNVVVISPDEGGFKRAQIVANKLNVPFLAMSKRRDYSQENKVEESILLGDQSQLQGKTAIVIDDMLDTGGTVIKTVEVLVKFGARDVIVGVTHGLLSDPAITRINQCEHLTAVIISDSLPTYNHLLASDKIKVFSIAKLISKVINRLVNGLSLSEIFKQ